MDNYKIENALSGVYYLATTENDQPHVRPFDGAIIIDNKLFIATGKGKNVYKQILKNPKIEIFGMENNMIRFTAEAYPIEDEEKNKEIHESLGKNYNEDSIALELKNVKGILTDSMGEKTDFSF